MAFSARWLRERVWYLPRWICLLGILVIGAAIWWQFFVPKPAPLAAPLAAAPLVLEGTPVPQPHAPITPDNAAHIVPLVQFGEDTPRLIVASPDNRWLAAGSPSGIAIYDSQTLSPTHLLNTPFLIGGTYRSNLAVASDGATVAAINGNDLWLRPASGTARLITNDGSTSDDDFTSLVFAPDSTMLAAAERMTIRLFRASDGALLRSYRQGAREEVLAFSPDGAWLLTHTDTAVLMREVGNWWRFWSPIDVTPFDATPTSAAFSLDGARVAIGTDDGRVEVKRFEAGRLLDERTAISGLPPITGVAFAPDGWSLAVGAQGDVLRLVHVPEPTGYAALLATLPAHTRPLSATEIAAFAPDGTLTTVAFEPEGVAPNSTSNWTTMRRWHVPDGVQIGEHLWGQAPAPRIRFAHDDAPTAFRLDDQTTKLPPDTGDTAYLELGVSPPPLVAGW